MTIHSPPADWFKAPTGHERLWLALAIGWCIVLFAMMPYWHFQGKQNSTGQSYRVSPEDFAARVAAFQEAHGVDEINVHASLPPIPVVEPPPGGDAYLIGHNWQWTPVLRLKRGVTYQLHVSSGDYQHGFSLLPLNMNFHVVPGYDHVLTITPTTSGEFPIICNEFCGVNHHSMTGRIIVVD